MGNSYVIAPGTVEDTGKLVDIYDKGDAPGKADPLAVGYEVTSHVGPRGRDYNCPRDFAGPLTRHDHDVDVYLHDPQLL